MGNRKQSEEASRAGVDRCGSITGAAAADAASLKADQAPLFPSTRMPNYPESALSDTEARDIDAFIRSFRLNAPYVEDVPTLQSIIESASRPYEP